MSCFLIASSSLSPSNTSWYMQDWRLDLSLSLSWEKKKQIVCSRIFVIYFLGGIEYYYVVGGGEKLKLAGTVCVCVIERERERVWRAKVYDDTYHLDGRKASSSLFYLEWLSHNLFAFCFCHFYNLLSSNHHIYLFWLYAWT